MEKIDLSNPNPDELQVGDVSSKILLWLHMFTGIEIIC